MTDLFHIAILSDAVAFREAVRRELADIIDTRVHLMDACHEGTPDTVCSTRPSLVLIDAGEREQDALATLAAIQRFNATTVQPIHALLVSHFTPRVVPMLAQAIDCGHFDHILAPDNNEPDELTQLVQHVSAMVIAVIGRQRRQSTTRLRQQRGPATPTQGLHARREPIEAILIGASTGGPQALTVLLPELCRLTKLPILIVQHIQQSFTLPLAQSLNAKCEATVIEAIHDGTLQPGHAYIAPGGTHLVLARTPDGVRMRLSDAPPEQGCRPAVNALFRSGAEALGARTVAAVLTGMGCDGAAGAQLLKAAGALVVVQDESTSVVWGMPGSVVAAKAADAIRPLDALAAEIASMAQSGRRT